MTRAEKIEILQGDFLAEEFMMFVGEDFDCKGKAGEFDKCNACDALEACKIAKEVDAEFSEYMGLKTAAAEPVPEPVIVIGPLAEAMDAIIGEAELVTEAVPEIAVDTLVVPEFEGVGETLAECAIYTHSLPIEKPKLRRTRLHFDMDAGKVAIVTAKPETLRDVVTLIEGLLESKKYRASAYNYAGKILKELEASELCKVIDKKKIEWAVV